MIYIQTLDRVWSPGLRLIPDKLRHEDTKTRFRINREFQEYIAEEYLRLVVHSIDVQRYRAKWRDLTIPYMNYKIKNNLSINIWEATGELKRSIKLFRRCGRFIIGFDKRRVHKGSKAKLYKIAEWMEYGTIRMPPRPLFRFVYIYMSKNIEFFFYKFCRDRGYL